MSEAKVTAEEAFTVAFACIKELKLRIETLEDRVNWFLGHEEQDEDE